MNGDSGVGQNVKVLVVSFGDIVSDPIYSEIKDCQTFIPRLIPRKSGSIQSHSQGYSRPPRRTARRVSIPNIILRRRDTKVVVDALVMVPPGIASVIPNKSCTICPGKTLHGGSRHWYLYESW